MWPDQRIVDLFGLEFPIIQAPMAGVMNHELVVAVSEAGGLGSLPCAMLSPAEVRAELAAIRARTSRPFNVNFFYHAPPRPDAEREAAWKARLSPYYAELGIDPATSGRAPARAPFNDAMCEIVAETRPMVVSFHFGLPEPRLLDRVKTLGCRVLSSATTAAEARWLESMGVDAVIAQGYEAGGHRGMFLTQDVAAQAGTLALVPQVVDAVKVPVIAAGGIADARGIAAAFALGAAAAQIGTAYLLTPEAKVSPLHRAALLAARDDQTVLTNVFSGRPARGILNRVVREVGPISGEAPDFPLAAGAVAPLRARAEALGSADFSALCSGQAAALARDMGAGELTRQLAEQAGRRLRRLGSG